MGRFLARRIVGALLLVFVVASGTLLLTRLAPGETADEALHLTAAERVRLRAELGLDRPFGAQYLDWLAGAVRMDLGWSVVFSRPVADMLSERALNTGVLALTALLTATLLGIPAGIYTGSHPHGVLSAALRLCSLMLLSVPPLIASLVLVLIAARTGWVPVGGMTSAAAGSATWSAWFADFARHVPLPALALALPLAATLERLQAQAIDEAAREPFVRAALARGVSNRQAIQRHAWPVSLPAVLGLYGIMIGSLFSGSFIVEVVTAWPGLGRLMYDALRARDLFLVTGCAAAGAVFLAAGTLAADVLLAVADPRQRAHDRG